MNLLKIVKQNHLGENFKRCVWGIEREGLRATDQRLALTSHPKSLGSRVTHPYIQTDYSDSQPELITPPLSPLSFSYHWLCALTGILQESLNTHEYLWPFSMPCVLPESDEKIPISSYTSQEIKQYRQETGEKYGRKRQLITGIHLNFSLPDDLVWQLFQSQDEMAEKSTLTDYLYLKMSVNFLRYQWLLVYYFGASPVADETLLNSDYYKKLPAITSPVRSLRSSVYGFQNIGDFVVRYDSLEHYVADIQAAVEQGYLKEEREYYENVRLRHLSNQSTNLLRDGIQYLEFRLFDLDPFSPYGIGGEQLNFVHLFLLTMLFIPQFADNEGVEAGREKIRSVALESPYRVVDDVAEGRWLIDQMQNVAQLLYADVDVSQWLNKYRTLLDQPSQTLSARIVDKIKNDGGFLTLGQKLGEKHRNHLLKTDDYWGGFGSLWPGQRLKLAHAMREGNPLNLMQSFLYRDHMENFSSWLQGQMD